MCCISLASGTLADTSATLSDHTSATLSERETIVTGAEQSGEYLPYLQAKRVAVLANPTTIIGKKHLIDSLFSLGINIVKVFSPEHGFRGNTSAAVKWQTKKTASPVSKSFPCME